MTRRVSVVQVNNHVNLATLSGTRSLHVSYKQVSPINDLSGLQITQCRVWLLYNIPDIS